LALLIPGCVLAGIGFGFEFEFGGDGDVSVDVADADVYEEESDDAKSDVDLDCDCKCESGRMGREGSAVCFGFSFVFFFEFGFVVLEFCSVCVHVRDEGDEGSGNDTGGGGLGGKEGCADVDATGKSEALRSNSDDDSICLSLASISAILSLGFEPSPLPLFSKLSVVGFPLSIIPFLYLYSPPPPLPLPPVTPIPGGECVSSGAWCA